MFIRASIQSDKLGIYNSETLELEIIHLLTHLAGS